MLFQEFAVTFLAEGGFHALAESRVKDLLKFVGIGTALQIHQFLLVPVDDQVVDLAVDADKFDVFEFGFQLLEEMGIQR